LGGPARLGGTPEGRRTEGVTPRRLMRFHFGAIPGSPEFVPDASWRSLRQPSPWLGNLLALPIGAVAAVVVTVLWFLVTPLRELSPAMSPPTFLLSFAGLVVGHMLILERAGHLGRLRAAGKIKQLTAGNAKITKESTEFL
jgi:hypothetical protein